MSGAAASFTAFDNEPPEITMPWGKYQGQPLSAVELGYLEWCATKADRCDPALRDAIAMELGRRMAQPSDRHKWAPSHDESTLDLARLIVECGIGELKAHFGFDNTFGKACEFLRGEIEREPVENEQRAF